MPEVRLTCPLDCPDTCSLLVTVENGHAVKLRGDPTHPVTQGFACSKTYKYPDRMYLESRPLYPMKRVGAKGSGQWQRLTWDEALDEIAVRLKATLETHGAESILRYNYIGKLDFQVLDAARGVVVTRGSVNSFTASAATRSTIAAAASTTDATVRLMQILSDLVVTQLLATSANWVAPAP